MPTAQLISFFFVVEYCHIAVCLFSYCFPPAVFRQHRPGVPPKPYGLDFGAVSAAMRNGLIASVLQNGLFWLPERAVSSCKTARSAV